MIKRNEYLAQLTEWKDKNVIKVITGIRRCGKSTLMKLFQKELLSQGVEDSQIIAINFEDLAFEELSDYKKLYEYIMTKINKEKTTYLFLDEIQKIEHFEKAVDSFFVQDNIDIYITGSNAFLLSGELATLLSGRYVEISMLPLSFKEFCQLREHDDKDLLFSEYLKIGSFPYVVGLPVSEEMVDVYLEGIYNTVIVKDIEERQQRKTPDPSRRKINDIALLKNVSKFLANSIGNPISIKSISDYITSSGRKVSYNTVDDYIEALKESFVFYSAERFDVNGKNILKTNPKMYIVDLGLRRHLVSKKNYDLGFALENIVYLELRRRGYSVYVGKSGDGEVDFVAKKADRILYFQVTASMMEESTFEREMRSLRAISDNYPKIVLTLDRFTLGNYEGIEVVNAVDWLLGK
ncbi:MAG: ATP-binding protein [Clostridia bacterium]|nr:ATP-binding protein [Clostridia bacterium]